MNSTSTRHFLAVQRRELTPAHIIRWRQTRGLGQGHFGKLFRNAGARNGYHRTYISKVERGVMPITHQFAERFEIVRVNWQHEHNERRVQSGLIQIISKYRIPRAIKVLRQPRRCTTCGDWFIPCSTRQKRCGDCAHGRQP